MMVKISYSYDDLIRVIKAGLKHEGTHQIIPGEFQIQLTYEAGVCNGLDVIVTDKIKLLSRQYSKKRDAVRKRKYRMMKMQEKTIPAYLTGVLASYAAVRISMRKPLTDDAVRLIVRDLVKWYPGDREKQIQCLEDAIKGSWNSVFKLKDDRKESKPKRIIYDFEVGMERKYKGYED